MPCVSIKELQKGLDTTTAVALLNRPAKILLVMPDAPAVRMAEHYFALNEYIHSRRSHGIDYFRADSGASIRIVNSNGLFAGFFKPHRIGFNTYIEAGEMNADYMTSELRAWLMSKADEVPEAPPPWRE